MAANATSTCREGDQWTGEGAHAAAVAEYETRFDTTEYFNTQCQSDGSS